MTNWVLSGDEERVVRLSHGVTKAAGASGSPVFIEAKGSGSENIMVTLNRMPKGVQQTAFVAGASADAVVKRGCQVRGAAAVSYYD